METIDRCMRDLTKIHVYVDMTYISRHLRQANSAKIAKATRREPAVFNLEQLQESIIEFIGNLDYSPRHNTYFELFFAVDSTENQTKIEKLLNSEFGRKWIVHIETSPIMISKIGIPVPEHTFSNYLGRKTWNNNSVLNIFVTDDPLIITHVMSTPHIGIQKLIVGPDKWADGANAVAVAGSMFMPITKFIEETGADKPINRDGTNWIPLE